MYKGGGGLGHGNGAGGFRDSRQKFSKVSMQRFERLLVVLVFENLKDYYE
jgi:hypothetical protein